MIQGVQLTFNGLDWTVERWMEMTRFSWGVEASLLSFLPPGAGNPLVRKVVLKCVRARRQVNVFPGAIVEHEVVPESELDVCEGRDAWAAIGRLIVKSLTELAPICGWSDAELLVALDRAQETEFRTRFEWPRRWVSVRRGVHAGVECEVSPNGFVGTLVLRTSRDRQELRRAPSVGGEPNPGIYTQLFGTLEVAEGTALWRDKRAIELSRLAIGQFAGPRM